MGTEYHVRAEHDHLVLDEVTDGKTTKAVATISNPFLAEPSLQLVRPVQFAKLRLILDAYNAWVERVRSRMSDSQHYYGGRYAAQAKEPCNPPKGLKDAERTAWVFGWMDVSRKVC